MSRVALALFALALSASAAAANPGVRLHVGDCGAGAAQASIANACAGNTGDAFTLVGSAVLPAVTKTGVVGMLAIVNVGFTDPNVAPDWWRFDTCRPAAFAMVADSTTGGTCPSFWSGVKVAGSAMAEEVGAGGPASRIRIVIASVADAPDSFTVVGDGVTEETLFRLTVHNAGTTGAGACAGCSTGACLIIAEAEIQGYSDTTPADFLSLQPEWGQFFVTYNSGYPVCPDSVPARNRTWGSLKALYR